MKVTLKAGQTVFLKADTLAQNSVESWAATMADCLDELWAVHLEKLLAAHLACCLAATMVCLTAAMMASKWADGKECLKAGKSVNQKADQKAHHWAGSTGRPLAEWMEQSLAALWVVR